MIFLKHIWRTLRSRPFQPLLIVFTVALAVGTAVTAFRYTHAFLDHAQDLENEQTAMGDILISLSASSEERILFSHDVQDMVGERCDVIGEYSLTGFMDADGKRESVFVAATNPESADRYFDFKYLEYGSFTTLNLDNSAIISESFAQRHGFGVGDELELSLLGENVSYTVQAVVAEQGYLMSRDVLVSISGVVRLLGQKSPAIAALGGSLEPSNRLMIRVKDACEVENIFEILKKSESFSDDYVENTRNGQVKDTALLAELVGIILPAVLLTLLAGILIVTALASVDVQRRFEYALFRTAGASTAQLAVLRLTESGIYAVIGGALGVLLAHPMLSAVDSFFAWQTNGVGVGVLGALFGISVSVLLMVGCTAINICRGNKLQLAEQLQDQGYDSTRKDGHAGLLISAAVLLISLAVMALLPAQSRVLSATVALGATIVIAYLGSPFLFKGFFKIVERIVHKKRPSAEILLALKNIQNNYSVKHLGRLLAVLLSMLLAVFVSCGTIAKQHTMLQNAFDGEIMAYNLPESIEQELKDAWEIEGVASFAADQRAIVNGKYAVLALMVDGDVQKCINRELAPKNLPKSHEAVITKGVAILLDVSVGDEISVSIQGNAHQLTVSEVQQANSNIVYVHPDVANGAQTVSCIKLKENVTLQQTEEIVGRLGAKGVATANQNEYTIKGLDTVEGFVLYVGWSAAIAILISAVGIINTLSGAYLMRKNEKDILCQSGMTRRNIRLMGFYEILMTTAFAAILAVAFGAVLCTLVNICVQSFGFVMF